MGVARELETDSGTLHDRQAAGHVVQQNAGLAGTYGNQALGALGQGQTAAGQYQQANPYQSTLGQITSGLGTIGSLASGGLGSLVGIGKRKTG